MMELLDISLVAENSICIRKVWKESEFYLYLALSVKERGVLMPILVRQIDKGYEIIKGHHRYDAAKDAGFSHIPALVIIATDTEVEEIQLITSTHICETKPVEFQRALLRLAERKPYTTLKDMAKRIKKSPQWIRDHLALQRLYFDAAQLVNDGKIVLLNAYILTKLENAEQLNYLDAAKSIHPTKFYELIKARIQELRNQRREQCKGKVSTKVCVAHVFREFFEDGGTETEFIYQDDPRAESLQGCKTIEEVRIVLKEPSDDWKVTSVQLKDRVII